MQYIIRGKSFVFTTEIRDNTTLRKSFSRWPGRPLIWTLSRGINAAAGRTGICPTRWSAESRWQPMYRSTGWIFSWTVGAEPICSWAPS